jgi:hypothetical protein
LLSAINAKQQGLSHAEQEYFSELQRYSQLIHTRLETNIKALELQAREVLKSPKHPDEQLPQLSEEQVHSVFSVLSDEQKMLAKTANDLSKLSVRVEDQLLVQTG